MQTTNADTTECMASPREQMLLERFLALPDITHKNPPALRAFRDFVDRLSRIPGGPRFFMDGDNVLVKTRKAGSGIYGICSDETRCFLGRRFTYLVAMSWLGVLPSEYFFIVAFSGVSTTENCKVETNGYFVTMPLLDGNVSKDPFSRFSIYCWVSSPESQPVFLTDEFFLRMADSHCSSKEKKNSRVITRQSPSRSHHKVRPNSVSDFKVQETSEQSFFCPPPVQAKTSPESEMEKTSAPSGVLSDDSSLPVQNDVFMDGPNEEDMSFPFQLPPFQSEESGEIVNFSAGESSTFLMDDLLQTSDAFCSSETPLGGYYPDNPLSYY
jgi:hypothetical protein